MKSYFLKAYSHQDRWASMEEIKQIVNKYGCITDVKLFSDISISLTIELNFLNISDLSTSLSQFLLLDEVIFSPCPPETECVLFLNITFANAKGNLSIEVPAVPG